MNTNTSCTNSKISVQVRFRTLTLLALLVAVGAPLRAQSAQGGGEGDAWIGEQGPAGSGAASPQDPPARAPAQSDLPGSTPEEDPATGESPDTSEVSDETGSAGEGGWNGQYSDSLTRAEAERLLVEMGDRATRRGFTPDHVENGCNVRAWYYEEAALEFVKDDGTKLDPDAIERFQIVGGTEPGSRLQYKDGWTPLGDEYWSFHTTSRIPVRNEDGEIEPMIFDPAVNPHAPVDQETFITDLLPDDSAYRIAQGRMDRGQREEDAVVVIEPNSHEDYAYMVPYIESVRPDPGQEEKWKEFGDRELGRSFRHIYQSYTDWEKKTGEDRYTWEGRPTGRF